jgi:hypothetical protein
MNRQSLNIPVVKAPVRFPSFLPQDALGRRMHRGRSVVDIVGRSVVDRIEGVSGSYSNLLSFHLSIRASPSLPYVPATVGESMATRSSTPLPQGRLPRYHKVVCPATQMMPTGRLLSCHKGVRGYTAIARRRRRCRRRGLQGRLSRYRKVVYSAATRGSEATQPSLGAGAGA